MLSTLLPFLGACALIAASPGPSTMLIIRQSLRSKRAGFLTVLGNETGVFVWGVVAACGLTALLTASQLAYDLMRVVGAVTLVWFGIRTLLDSRRGHPAEADPARATAEADPAGATAEPERSGLASYRSGLLLNLANPKAAVFAMSFLPQFVPQGAPALPSMIGLAAVWAVFEIGWYGLYVWFVARLRAVVSRVEVRRRLEQVSGGVLLLLGIRMAVEG
ncbi:lysine transporter LysE [Kitasatospora sp. MMS16-BH015]|uniref:LysE family translocator n=1 Tax=Kitasatospora sp. MMS16-BH015 TaxID=2018025 RepID=UPI000CA2B107|nr:LysE family translocator [Kitasatospora sp. MMS16-BH015]AUG75100.1 lysine transporter LysE [Kitasatospora sp. MMS16-BH015]